MSGQHANLEPQSSVADLAVFQYRDRVCTFHEILAWSEFTGRLEELKAYLLRTERSLIESAEVRPEHLQQAATELRYRNGLITADETEAWLTERSLDINDLYRHLQREFSADSTSVSMSTDEWCDSVPDVFHETWAELHFTGRFNLLVESFIFRVAVVDMKPPAEVEGRSLNLNTDHLSKMLLAGHVDSVRSLEGRFVEYAETVASADSCQRRLKSHRMELLEVEYQSLTYETEDSALEAQCCIRYDGEDAYALAERTGVLLSGGSSFVEDLPEEVGRHLLSAQPGECLKPVQLPDHDGFTIFRLLNKNEPDLASAGIMKRIRRRIVSDALSEEIERNLRWLPWQPEA